MTDRVIVGHVLVVAGRDSSRAAGLDADADALAKMGARGSFVCTAETVQDSSGVRELGAREPDVWLREALEALATSPDAIKFGLLPGVAHAAAASRLVRAAREQLGPLPVVLDPVLAASSGSRFLDDAGVQALLEELLPLGLVWTPNAPEAEELGDLSRGARAIVIKGGHGDTARIEDLVRVPGEPDVRLVHPRLPAALRGTGCRFASALAAGLAAGRPLVAAASGASALVARCLRDAGA